MKQRLIAIVMLSLALSQTGCIHVQYLDAVSAGVFDFLSGAVNEILTSTFVTPLLPS